VNDLSDSQIAEARRLWEDGFSLGAIAGALQCSLYALSPWLYTEDTPANAKYRAALGYEPGEAV
jgi:hypothetical protein